MIEIVIPNIVDIYDFHVRNIRAMVQFCFIDLLQITVSNSKILVYDEQ